MRDLLMHALQADRFTLGQAVEYTIVELGLLNDDSISEALSFSALVKVALEIQPPEPDERELLSTHLQKHCDRANAVKAAAALEIEEDRQAFMRDLSEVRAALGIR